MEKVKKAEGFKKITGQMNSKGNGEVLSAVSQSQPRPEAQVASRLVGLLVGIIQQNGELLEQCADALSAFDIEAAEEAWDGANVCQKIVAKVKNLEMR